MNFRLSVMEVVRVGEEVDIKSNGVENEEGQEYSEVLGGVHCHLHLHRHHPLVLPKFCSACVRVFCSLKCLITEIYLAHCPRPL